MIVVQFQRNFFFSQGISSCLQWLHNSPSICPSHNPPLLSAFWHLLFRLLSLFIPPLLHSTRRVQHQHPDPFIRSYIHNVKTIPPKQNSKFYAMSLYTIVSVLSFILEMQKWIHSFADASDRERIDGDQLRE